MQANEITLTVDVDNDGATTADETQVYSRHEEHLNRSLYIAEDHTVAAPHTLSLYRTQPKVNGNFLGMAKSAVKFSECLAVEGADGVTTVKAPLICEISFSVPVGTSSAQLMEMRQRAVALLDDDTIMDNLSLTLMI
jgi:hypothetical protein